MLDAVGAWFGRQDEPGLVDLVRKSLEDKRLILLVDGIDEWDNKTAANTALGLLQSFAERRSIPVILTSRPHGFRLMNSLAGSWRISDIAPLTTDQQCDLATVWFKHLGPKSDDDERSASKSRQRAKDFVTELQRNGPIAQLGATPLLLTGLIALKQARLQLPRNRFQAYAALTKLLLKSHPTAREKAALAGSPRHGLDPVTQETALAALAFAIHSGQGGSSADSIEMDRAVTIVSQCLMERLGTPANEAPEKARTFLSSRRRRNRSFS